MKILVLAGGADQIALIIELKHRGHFVILVDYFQNPPARGFADKHIVESTLDIDKVKQIAIQEKVDLICTACTDQALLTVAKVSEELSLPCYISYKNALNVTNKSFMKDVMVKNKIPTSRYVILNKIEISSLKEFSYPLVVKPVDCNSSKGVRKVFSEVELIEALSLAISYSRSKTAIIEEFIEGEEISADFYVEGKKVKFLSATKSTKINNEKTFTILQSCYPAINIDQEKRLIEIANKIVSSFHLENTPLLVQLILKNDKFYVLEFSARMGGGSKYRLIERLSGVNIMSKYVDLILGENPVVCPSKQVSYATMNYIYCLPGILKQVKGWDKLKDNNVIDDFFVYKTMGMEITKAEMSGDRVAGYLITAFNEGELKEKQLIVDSNLSVLDMEGNDIMLHNLI